MVHWVIILDPFFIPSNYFMEKTFFLETQIVNVWFILFFDSLYGTHFPIFLIFSNSFKRFKTVLNEQFNWIERFRIDCRGSCSRSSYKKESFASIGLPGRSLSLRSKSQELKRANHLWQVRPSRERSPYTKQIELVAWIAYFFEWNS